MPIRMWISSTSCLPLSGIDTAYGYSHHIDLENVTMGKKHTHSKDRSDIGAVEFPIEKLMEFRDARASCVHIEVALEADRGLTGNARKRLK